MQVKKQQLEPDMEQQSDSNLGKEVYEGYTLSPWLFNLYVEYIIWNARLDDSPADIYIYIYMYIYIYIYKEIL